MVVLCFVVGKHLDAVSCTIRCIIPIWIEHRFGKYQLPLHLYSAVVLLSLRFEKIHVLLLLYL